METETMKTTNRWWVGCLTVLAASEASADKLYKLTDLVVVAGHPILEATAITGAGQVAVNATDNFGFWTPYLHTNGNLIPMATTGTQRLSMSILASSPSGLMGGVSSDFGGYLKPTIFFTTGGKAEVDIQGVLNATIRGLNDLGQRVGEEVDVNQMKFAFFVHNGNHRRLTGEDSIARGINSLGEVVGDHYTNGERKAFYYDSNTTTFTDRQSKSVFVKIRRL